MPKRTDISKILIITALLTASHLASACSYVFAPEKVKPTFVIQVKGFGEAISGVRVEATHLNRSFSEDTPSHISFSDRDGYAHFDNLPVGMYVVRADRFSANTMIEVVPDPETKISYVQIGWPGTFSSAGYSAPLKSKRLVGRILGEWESCTLSLRDGLTGQKVGDEVKGGTFDFATLPSGPYMLEIGCGELSGDIAILVTPDASNDDLRIDVGFSSCGISYSEARNCPANKVETSQLRGTVVDVTGAVIASARVALFRGTDGASAVNATSADRSGQWQLDDIRPGEYRLEITRSGFGPYVAPLSISLGAPKRDLLVTLGLMGTCPKVELKSEN